MCAQPNYHDRNVLVLLLAGVLACAGALTAATADRGAVDIGGRTQVLWAPPHEWSSGQQKSLSWKYG